jgi:hypothetical protein
MPGHRWLAARADASLRARSWTSANCLVAPYWQAGGLAATAGAPLDVPSVGDAIATGDVTKVGGDGSPGAPTGLSVGLSGRGDAAMSG